MNPIKPVVVTFNDGLRGVIEGEPKTQSDGKTYFMIRLRDGHRVLVPDDLLEKQEAGMYRIPYNSAHFMGTGQVRHAETVSTESAVFPVIEEELKVGKRTVEKGKVRVVKRVHEKARLVDEPGFEEEVDVERVPINRVINKPAAPRYEGNTLIVPIMEEVVVVEKRLVLKEEVRITKRRKEVREPREFIVRREEIDVEQVSSS